MPNDRRIRILIAEDSRTQAERLRHMLEREGYAVSVAQNGRAALELLREFAPSLVISDVVMPEMDGYELSRRMRSDTSQQHIPIILVTTMSDPEDVLRGLECGADSFVLKPYEPEYLLARVRDALASRASPIAHEPGAAAEIWFRGEKHVIQSDRRQILNLLLSTYDAAIERNKQLQRSREHLQAANEKLNQANADLEAFSYSASHDLRAPLRHISGFSALLVRELDEQLSPNAVHYLDEVTSASARMSKLIGDLLEFSRVDRAAMDKRSVDLQPLVASCISELAIATRERTIDWRIGPLPSVIGDPAMLKQVFANLIDNAVKYTGRRDAAVIEIGSAADGQQVEVFVRDNGAGFDMKYADKLFKAFQRLHGSDEFEGTGIGLASVRRIVERHGGRIRAESAPGEGATFYVTFSIPASSTDGFRNSAASDRAGTQRMLES